MSFVMAPISPAPKVIKTSIFFSFNLQFFVGLEYSNEDF